jgi:hypothetical protein
MVERMFVQVPMLSGPAVVRVEDSLPYVLVLIGDDGKYYIEPKPIEDETEKRRYRARGPTLRFLASWRCEETRPNKQLSEKLRQRMPYLAAAVGATWPS